MHVAYLLNHFDMPSVFFVPCKMLLYPVAISSTASNVPRYEMKLEP